MSDFTEIHSLPERWLLVIRKKGEAGKCLIESADGSPLSPSHFLCPLGGLSWQTHSSYGDDRPASPDIADDGWCCRGFRLWGSLNAIVPSTASGMENLCILERERAILHNWTGAVARCFIAGWYSEFWFLFSGCQTNGRILRSGHPTSPTSLKLSIWKTCFSDKRKGSPDVMMASYCNCFSRNCPYLHGPGMEFQEPPPRGAGICPSTTNLCLLPGSSFCLKVS